MIDELAHTNAPGSPHPKRYQDVEDIRLAGIHVITTVNVQHLESLYDEIERVTNVRVKERIPDRVLAEADQIVNVNVTVEDLIERLSTGKIYPEERVSTALENFFTAPNLTRLRELALTEIAHLIDRRTRRAEADQFPLSATNRVMVGLSSRSPNAPALLRKTSRLADRIHAPWYAVYIQVPAEDLTRIDAATQRLIGKNLELAQQLGGVPMTFRGPDVASTILSFARIRHQDHRRGQEPSILVPAPLEDSDPGTAGTRLRGNRHPHCGCLTPSLKCGISMTESNVVRWAAGRGMLNKGGFHMGCLGVHFALTEVDVETLRSLPDEGSRLDRFQEVIEEDYFADHRDYVAESDKAWDAMHRALTDGQLTWDGGQYPFNHVVLAGELLYTKPDYIMSLKTPAQVRDVVAAIADITEADFRRLYFAIDPDAYGFPLSEDDFGYTWTWFLEVRNLFLRAAKEGRYVLFSADQ